MIGGRYTLDRQIGRGGMGSVWLGRDEVLGRPVAIKQVGVAPGGAAEGGSPDQQRAEREARLAASLNHPHVVGVFDLVHEGDQQWLVMEYVAGTTLAEQVRSRGPLPDDEVAAAIAQTADALAAAHEAGIVHRDVKPSNLLVREDGEVKLSDFGIARGMADPSLTQTGLVTGSPAYLAPEVASGRQAGPPADVWSLGATAFHAAAGRAPYEVGDNVLGALYRIVHEDPPRLPAGHALAELVEHTMVIDPDQRWTAAEVARHLGQAPTRMHAEPLVTAPLPAGVGATEVLPVAPVEPPQAQPVERSPVPPVAPPIGAAEPPAWTPGTPGAPGTPGHSAAARRRRRGVLPLVVAGLVLALVVVIVVLALQKDPQQVGNTPSADPSSDPSTPSSPSSSASTAPTKAALESFARDYLATADADPNQSFAELTPAFQRASGGIDGYVGFWGDVKNVKVETVSGDPSGPSVTYTYSYVKPGLGKRTDTVTLQLEQRGDRFLVSGETDGG